MYEIFIKQYIDKLNKDDVIKFAKKNGVNLESYEVDVIYSCIKNDWKIIIFGNPTKVFNDLKNKVKDETYNKCVSLYNKYKNNFFNSI